MSEATERIRATMASKEYSKCMLNLILFFPYNTARRSVFLWLSGAKGPLQIRGGRAV